MTIFKVISKFKNIMGTDQEFGLLGKLEISLLQLQKTQPANFGIEMHKIKTISYFIP